MTTFHTASNSPTRAALLVKGGWGGRTETEVKVIGETPKRYRIEAITRTKLAGRERWIGPGETALVPKYAVHFRPDEVKP